MRGEVGRQGGLGWIQCRGVCWEAPGSGQGQGGLTVSPQPSSLPGSDQAPKVEWDVEHEDMNVGLCPAHGHHIPLEPLCVWTQSAAERRRGEGWTSQAGHRATMQHQGSSQGLSGHLSPKHILQQHHRHLTYQTQSVLETTLSYEGIVLKREVSLALWKSEFRTMVKFCE